MRLEITVDGGRPFYFPISKDVLILGSSSTADIKIPQMHLSRKHLALHTIGDTFFIEDLGSTNGTYINDEKLEPLKKREFTSFFPVRLGSVVLIALVPEEEEDSSESEAAPFEKSLASIAEKNELTTTQVISDINKRQEIKLENKSLGPSGRPTFHRHAPKKKSSSLVVQLIVMAFVIGGAGYYVYTQKVEEEAQIQAASIQAAAAVVEAVAKEQPKPKAKQIDLITDEDFISRAEMETVLARVKCVLDIEKVLCETIEGAQGGNWGATVLDDQMVIAVDGTSFYDEAKKFVPVPEAIKSGGASVAMLVEYDDNIWKLASSLFVKRSLSKMPYAKLKDELLVFGLYYKKDSGYRLGTEIVAQANQLQNASVISGTKLLNDVQLNGPQVLAVLDRYYRTKASDL